MLMAIEEAKLCESPKKFGALVVYYGLTAEGEVITRAHNTVQEDCDLTAHAEYKAISTACRKLKNNRFMLRECTLYTTCEPCVMCTGAVLLSYVDKVVYGMQRGESPNNFSDSQIWHRHIRRIDLGHRILTVQGGILAVECAKLMPPPDPNSVREVDTALFNYEWPNI